MIRIPTWKPVIAQTKWDKGMIQGRKELLSRGEISPEQADKKVKEGRSKENREAYWALQFR